MDKTNLLFSRVFCFFACFPAFIAASTSEAAFLPLTDAHEFMARLDSGSMFEDFASLPPELLDSSLSFSQGGFGFTVTASEDTDLYRSTSDAPMSPWLSTAFSGVDILITFDGGPVTAFGATFWITTMAEDPQEGPLTVFLNEGPAIELMSSAGNDQPFLGFISTDGTPIDTLRISTAVPGGFVTIGDTYTGSAIPEPGSYVLFASLAVLGFAGWRRRRR